MNPRPLTQRERAVLEALLAVEFEHVKALRRQAAEATVVGWCECGCPSVDFERGAGLGMTIRVNAGVRGSHNGLFLYTITDAQQRVRLGGIEWVGFDDSNPVELPPPHLLDIWPV